MLFRNGYSDEQGNLLPNAFEGLSEENKNLFYTAICYSFFYKEAKYEQIIHASQIAGYLDRDENVIPAAIEAVSPSNKYQTLRILLETFERQEKVDKEFSILNKFFCDDHGLINPGNIAGVEFHKQASEKAFLVSRILDCVFMLLVGNSHATLELVIASRTGQDKANIIRIMHSAGFCDEQGNIRQYTYNQLRDYERVDLIYHVVTLLSCTDKAASLDLLRRTGFINQNGEIVSARLAGAFSEEMRSLIEHVSQPEIEVSKEEALRELFLTDRLDEEAQIEQFKVTRLDCKVTLFDILPTEKFAKLFVGLLPEAQVELYQALRSDQQAALREHLSEDDLQVLDAARREF